MEYNFVGRNVDLIRLSDALAKYLEGEGFSVNVNKGDEAILLLAMGRIGGKFRQVAIKLFGNPSNFTIAFVERERLDPVFYNNMFWQFFGGGFLLREKYREVDFYRLMEDRFWRKVEEIINNFSSCNPLSSHP